MEAVPVPGVLNGLYLEKPEPPEESCPCTMGPHLRFRVLAGSATQMLKVSSSAVSWGWLSSSEGRGLIPKILRRPLHEPDLFCEADYLGSLTRTDDDDDDDDDDDEDEDEDEDGDDDDA